MVVKKEMSRRLLEEAFTGESVAHMKYMIFAEQAEREGYRNVAKLFRAIAHAELIHARNHFKALGKLRKTPENLDDAVNGERYEVEEMYPAFNSVASMQGEVEAVTSTRYALEAEKLHADMYLEAKKATEEGRDVDIGTVYVCPVCGYTVIGESPERCPVCGTPGDRFKRFE